MQVIHKKTRRTPAQIEAEVLKLIQSGMSIGVIQREAGIDQRKVFEVCDKNGLPRPARIRTQRPASRRKNEDYRKDTKTSDEVKHIEKCLKPKILDVAAKVNPRDFAENKMPHRFTERGEMKFFDGIWLKSFREWDNVIRELNKVLVAEGKRQIDYNKAWMV